MSTGCCIEAATSLPCLISSTLSGLPSNEAKTTSSARPDSSSAASAPSAASSCWVKKPQACGIRAEHVGGLGLRLGAGVILALQELDDLAAGLLDRAR